MAIALTIAVSDLHLRANPVDTGASVIVVYNSNVKDSEGVARHYAARRIVPKANLIGLALPDTEEITREQFATSLQQPLLAELDKRGLMKYVGGRVVGSKLRYVTLCYGVPLKIKRDTKLKEAGGEKLPAKIRGRNEASVDSELAWLPQVKSGPAVLAGAMGNAFYDSQLIYNLHSTNGILMVGRLDGPSPEIAKRLVDSAIHAETNGFWGRAYFDLRGIKSGEYQAGDQSLQKAANAAKAYGLDVVVDQQPGTFAKGFPFSHAGVYAGWYSESVTGPFAEKKAEFMPGAVAYHLHSFSADTIRKDDKNWVGPLLGQGVTATMGSVYEPYLKWTPDMGIFLDRLLSKGFSFGEAAYASQQTLSWMTTVVGDPLYRPCARHPKSLHEDLQARKRQELEWSHLRVVNLNLGKGTAATNMVGYLGSVALTRHSSVLLEKLGDVYEGAGQKTNAAKAWAMALQKPQSFQQHKRLLLKTARRLVAIKRGAEAKKLFEVFAKKYPQHPELAKIRAELAKL